jgi:hypothetical protein
MVIDTELTDAVTHLGLRFLEKADGQMRQKDGLPADVEFLAIVGTEFIRMLEKAMNENRRLNAKVEAMTEVCNAAAKACGVDLQVAPATAFTNI